MQSHKTKSKNYKKMTIETVLQVVGVIVDINTICRLTNKKSIHIPYEDEDENGGLHDLVAELLRDNNWTIIDYDKNIGLYRMTHVFMMKKNAIQR